MEMNVEETIKEVGTRTYNNLDAIKELVKRVQELEDRQLVVKGLREIEILAHSTHEDFQRLEKQVEYLAHRLWALELEVRKGG